MVPVNNITTTAIADELKVSSHNVGYLCSNKHGQINPAAKYKPVSYKKYERLTATELKSVRHGIDIPYISCGQVCESHPWVYQPPTGGENSPYRMSDFGGYSQDAVYPLTCILPDGDTIESTGSASTNNPFRFTFVFNHSRLASIDRVSLLADEVYTDEELGWYPTMVLTDGSNYYCISTPNPLSYYINKGIGGYGSEINLTQTPWYSSSSNGTTIKAGLCLQGQKCYDNSSGTTVGLNGPFTGYGRSVECTTNSHVRTYTIKVTSVKWYGGLKFVVTYNVTKSITSSLYNFSVSGITVKVSHDSYNYASFGNFYIKPYLHVAGSASGYNQNVSLNYNSYTTINGQTLNNSKTITTTIPASSTTYSYPINASGTFVLELRMCNSLNNSSEEVEVGSNGQQSINISCPFTNSTWQTMTINTTNSAFTAQLS